MHQRAPESAAASPQFHMPQQSVFSLPIPVPDLPRSHFVRPAFYSVTVVDGHGRIAVTSALRALGWPPGTVLAFGVDANRLITATRVEGSLPSGNTAPAREVTPRGHVNLPVTTRRRADVIGGDRLLIAADDDILWIVPPKALALMVRAYTSGQGRQL